MYPSISLSCMTTEPCQYSAVSVVLNQVHPHKPQIEMAQPIIPTVVDHNLDRFFTTPAGQRNNLKMRGNVTFPPSSLQCNYTYAHSLGSKWERSTFLLPRMPCTHFHCKNSTNTYTFTSAGQSQATKPLLPP